MKHILRMILIFLFLAIAYVVVRFNLRMPEFIFPICFGLSIVMVIGTICYFKFIKKQKIFTFLFMALVATFCFSPTAFSADAGTLKGIINANKSTLESKGSELQDYEAIMNGTKEVTKFDFDAYEAAHKINSACKELEQQSSSLSSYKKTCEDAQKYIDISGKVSNMMAVGCSPIKFLIKRLLNKNDCWPCDATALVISSIQRIAAASHNVLRTAALNLLGAFFLLWLAYVTLVYFGKFGFARVSEWLTNILNKSILVLCIAMFLHAPISEIYKYTVSPFVSFSADLSQMFADEGRRAAKAEGSIFKTLTNIASLGSGNGECSYCKKRGGGYVGSTAYLDKESVNSMLCMVCTVYHEVAPMIGLGQGMICFAGSAPTTNSENSMFGAVSNFTLPKPGPLAIGLTLILSFSLVMMLIAFHVILCVLQLGFVIILLPFYTMAFAFKATREYTKCAWDLLMHAMMSLVALSIAVALVMVGFSSLLDTKMALSLGLAMMDDSSPTQIMDVFSGKEDFSKAMGGGEGSGGLDVANIAKTVILNNLGISPFRAVMLLLVFCILAVRLINAAPEIVERLLNVWISRNADPQNMLMQGTQYTMRGVSTTTKALIAGGSLAIAKRNRDKERREAEEVRAAMNAEKNQKNTTNENKNKPSGSSS